MKFKKLCMLSVAALSLFSLASCKLKTEDKKTDPAVTTKENNVDKKYQIYLLATNSGFTGTYEEWLESIKGDSITVSVVDGKLQWKYTTEAESSYRLLFDLSTLKGEDGKSPVVTIGENGNWFIDGTDTEIRARANDGKGITGISISGSEGLVDTYTITFTDGTTAIFTVTNGKNGDNGVAGNGIRSITKSDSIGLVDTYIITFTNGDTTTFVVTNGKDGAEGTAGKGITSIIKGDTIGLVDSYVIVFSDGNTYTYNVTNGKNGENGAAGNGILKIEKTKTEGLVDTYTITFTNNETTTFTITNGAAGEGGSQGEEGNGISKIEKTNTEGLVDTYTITFTNGDTTTFEVTNGSTGTQGETGNGIAKIEKTNTEGLVDTYTITFTNGETTFFTITNGKDGEDATNDEIVTYSNNGLTKTVCTYDDDTVVEIVYRYNGADNWVYEKKNVTTLEVSDTDYETQTTEKYVWNSAFEKWIGKEQETNVYHNGIIYLRKTTTWSSILKDWDTTMYHVFLYSGLGNEIEDFYIKKAKDGNYYHYGLNRVYNDEIHSYSETNYVWNEDDELASITGEAKATIYSQDNKPLLDIKVTYSGPGYISDINSVTIQEYDSTGQLIGEPVAGDTTSHGTCGTTYFTWLCQKNIEYTINNLTYSYRLTLGFEQIAKSIYVDSYFESIDDYTDGLGIATYRLEGYKPYESSWKEKWIRQMYFDEDNHPSHLIETSEINGVEEILHKSIYEVDENGLISVEYIYQWDDDHENLELGYKYDSIRDELNRWIGSIGYALGEDGEWYLNFKVTCEYDELGQATNYRSFNWNAATEEWVEIL